MNFIVAAWVAWAFVLIGVLIAMVRTDFAFAQKLPRQRGVTSLSPNSVNWLAVVAVGAALAIVLIAC